MNKWATGILTAASFALASCGTTADEASSDMQRNSSTNEHVKETGSEQQEDRLKKEASPYKVSASNSYKLGSSNTVIVEFSPKADPNKVCIYVSGYKQAGLDCFDKPATPSQP